MSDNEKYKKVRSQLDSLNLCGTLHPDSVGLAEAMIKEYMKISSKYH
jgi:hypothetical protein